MRPVRNQPLLHCQLLEAARSRCVHKQSASARDDELTREETFAQDQKRSGPGVGVVALYCAMNPHTGMRIGVGEDGRRTTEACHRSSSPSARWLLFVVKEFSNIGSRRMRSTPSRQKRRLTSGAIGNGAECHRYVAPRSGLESRTMTGKVQRRSRPSCHTRAPAACAIPPAQVTRGDKACVAFRRAAAGQANKIYAQQLPARTTESRRQS